MGVSGSTPCPEGPRILAASGERNREPTLEDQLPSWAPLDSLADGDSQPGRLRQGPGQRQAWLGTMHAHRQPPNLYPLARNTEGEGRGWGKAWGSPAGTLTLHQIKPPLQLWWQPLRLCVCVRAQPGGAWLEGAGGQRSLSHMDITHTSTHVATPLHTHLNTLRQGSRGLSRDFARRSD